MYRLLSAQPIAGDFCKAFALNNCPMPIIPLPSLSGKIAKAYAENVVEKSLPQK